MSIVKKLAFQPDVLEWVHQQRTALRFLRKERYAAEKGFLAYGKDFVEYMRPKAKETEEVKAPEPAQPSSASRALEQYYESQDLIERMKWKRVTWDDDADYTSFSKRVLDNDTMFKRIPAFSFLSIHVVKDPSTSELVNIPTSEKVIVAGTLTNWLLQEREPMAVELYPMRKTAERRSAFHVDWKAGAVNILDTASAQELLTFLSSVAPRLQAVQLMMEEQQTRQVENVEKVRVRVGATLIYNASNTSFWDDPKRKTDASFVNPDEVEKFLTGMLKSAFLYRWFFKGHEIKVIPSGRPYYIDVEKKQVQIPANFVEYNWLSAHARFESIEKFAEACRRFWWFWFLLGIAILGDLELV